MQTFYFPILQQNKRAFYSTLYTSEVSVDNSKMIIFLDNLSIPTISKDLASDLDRGIDLTEIATAIRSMQSGKMPGPDGYSTDFYKKFVDKLSPLLLNVFQDSIENGQLPQHSIKHSYPFYLRRIMTPLGVDPSDLYHFLMWTSRLLSRFLHSV